MGMSFSTVEEKKQVRWFVMRAYKNEKMAEDRLKDKEYGLEYITVPDDQMDSFIQIASLYEKDTAYYKPDEIDVRKGTRVCIHGGKLDGVKGVFMRVKGKRNRRVVVMLEGIMGISAEVHPDLCSLCEYRHSPDSANRFSQTAVRPSR